MHVEVEHITLVEKTLHLQGKPLQALVVTTNFTFIDVREPIKNFPFSNYWDSGKSTKDESSHKAKNEDPHLSFVSLKLTNLIKEVVLLLDAQ